MGVQLDQRHFRYILLATRISLVLGIHQCQLGPRPGSQFGFDVASHHPLILAVKSRDDPIGSPGRVPAEYREFRWSGLIMQATANCWYVQITKSVPSASFDCEEGVARRLLAQATINGFDFNGVPAAPRNIFV